MFAKALPLGGSGLGLDRQPTDARGGGEAEKPGGSPARQAPAVGSSPESDSLSARGQA